MESIESITREIMDTMHQLSVICDVFENIPGDFTASWERDMWKAATGANLLSDPTPAGEALALVRARRLSALRSALDTNFKFERMCSL